MAAKRDKNVVISIKHVGIHFSLSFPSHFSMLFTLVCIFFNFTLKNSCKPSNIHHIFTLFAIKFTPRCISPFTNLKVISNLSYELVSGWEVIMNPRGDWAHSHLFQIEIQCSCSEAQIIFGSAKSKRRRNSLSSWSRNIGHCMRGILRNGSKIQRRRWWEDPFPFVY